MANRVGQQLGNYRLLRFLGDGAFAEVYLSEHILLGTQAAIKVLHAQLTSQEAQKFRDEARIIARLIHPNIIRILEFGIEGKTPFLVMDYAPNGTLQDRHDSDIPVPLNIVVTYVKQVADALQYAHDAKLIHRDVKPENLLIGQRDEIMLSDFGIAVAAHSTRTQVLQDKIGTLPYMAPEQIDGYPFPSSDQYALGIIVYKWLTGVLPFQGTDVEIITKHRHAPPPSLRAKMPTIPPLVEQAVLTALQKDPKKRFASIQAFANALEHTYLQAVAATLPVGQPVLPHQSPMPPTVPVAPINPPVVPTRRLGTLICKRNGSDQSMAWSPDGKHIASSSGAKVEVWDAASGKTISSYNHAANIAQVACSPDGKWLASASDDKTIQIRDTSTWNFEFTYTGHFGNVTKIAWSLDSRLVASVSNDSAIHIWDIYSGLAISTYRDALDAAWSPDGSRIAITSYAGIQVLALDKDNLRQVARVSFNEQTNSVSDVPSWGAPSQPVYQLPLTNSMYNLWSPTSKLLASHRYIGQTGKELVQIWDAPTGRPLFSYDGRGMAWSPDGTLIAIWTEDFRKSEAIQQSGAWGAQQQPYEPKVPKVVQIWIAVTGKHIYTYTGHMNTVNSITWSPSGTRIASSSDDSTVQVWNPTTGGSVYTYRGHSGAVGNALWSPDGGRIASIDKVNFLGGWSTPAQQDPWSQPAQPVNVWGQPAQPASAWGAANNPLQAPAGSSTATTNTIQVWVAG